MEMSPLLNTAVMVDAIHTTITQCYKRWEAENRVVATNSRLQQPSSKRRPWRVSVISFGQFSARSVVL